MTAPTCKIQWVDAHGNPTPDSNPAIGTAFAAAYTSLTSKALGYRPMEHSESPRFPICAQHAQQLNAPGMQHWHLRPLDEER